MATCRLCSSATEVVPFRRLFDGWTGTEISELPALTLGPEAPSRLLGMLVELPEATTVPVPFPWLPGKTNLRVDFILIITVTAMTIKRIIVKKFQKTSIEQRQAEKNDR